MVPIDSCVHETHSAALRRNARDSIFCDLFSREEYTLELYKELHPEDVEARIEDIQIVTIQNVIASGLYNDLGFIARGKLLVLVEAQTEWNDNITMRLFLYLAETYRRLVVEDSGFSLHGRKRAKLPEPELVVIYTGDRPVPHETSLARDFFGNEACAVDLRAQVITAPGSGIVGQFVRASKLIGSIAHETGDPGKKSMKFVNTCIEQGILVEYMKTCRAEVTDMMFTLFDEEEATRRYVNCCVAEGIEEGRAAGMAEGRAEAVAAVAEAMRRSGMSEAEIQSILREAESVQAS